MCWRFSYSPSHNLKSCEKTFYSHFSSSVLSAIVKWLIYNAPGWRPTVFYLSVVVSLPLWLTTTDDGFLVGRQPGTLCISKLGRADDADKDWRSLKKWRSFNFKSYRGCVIMKLTYHSVILSNAKDLITSTLCIQIFWTESSTTRLHYVLNDTTFW